MYFDNLFQLLFRVYFKLKLLDKINICNKYKRISNSIKVNYRGIGTFDVENKYV